MTGNRKEQTQRPLSSKAPKGYWIKVLTKEQNSDIVNTYSRLGLKHLGDVQIWLRKYKDTPGVFQIDVMINDHCIQSYTQEEIKTMGFATFQAENNYTTFAKPEIKDALVAYEVPFDITDVNLVETAFVNDEGEKQYSIQYTIELRTETAEYRMAKAKKDLVSQYILSLPANNYRRNEMKDLIKPFLAEHKKMPAVLSKSGKTYVFADVE